MEGRRKNWVKQSAKIPTKGVKTVSMSSDGVLMSIWIPGSLSLLLFTSFSEVKSYIRSLSLCDTLAQI